MGGNRVEASLGLFLLRKEGPKSLQSIGKVILAAGHWQGGVVEPQRRTTRAIGGLRILDAFPQVCPVLWAGIAKPSDSPPNLTKAAV